MRKLVAIVLLGLSLSACGTQSPSVPQKSEYELRSDTHNRLVGQLYAAIDSGEDLETIQDIAGRVSISSDKLYFTLENGEFPDSVLGYVESVKEAVALEHYAAQQFMNYEPQDTESSDTLELSPYRNTCAGFRRSARIETVASLQLRRSLGLPDAPVREVT